MDKALRRTPDDRIIAGVCGAFGRYFGIDSTLIRVAWVLVTLIGGSGILAYLLAWWVIPDEDGVRSPTACILVLALLVLPALCMLCLAPCGILSMLFGGGPD